jgi:probable O-glycosylation ligase (exosortase A-associated)
LRDVLVTFVIIGSLPFILVQPYVGVLVWTWIGLMNPHRLAWGFSRELPLAKAVGVVTLLGALHPSVPKRLPLSRESVLLLLFNTWMLFTTFFSLNPESAWAQWDKVIKIQAFTLVAMVLITTRKRLDQFIWIIVLSIGLYGVKGGLFTLFTGGQYHVMGPSGSFIEANNGLGMALCIVIPLMRYLQIVSSMRWVRISLTVSMVLTAIATVGTQSRGAALGLTAVLSMMAFKGRGKLYVLAFGFIVLPLVSVVMPQKWFERMETIRTYEDDASATGRIDGWRMATNLALDRPIVGGGFNCFTEEWFAVYAPGVRSRDIHSIYFEVLGEHGFPGLILFLTLMGCTWRTCSRISRRTASHEETLGLSDLARMMQVALFGYAVTGAFLGKAYFDLYYDLVAVVVVAKFLLREHLPIDESTTDPALVSVQRLRPTWARPR